MYCGQIVLDKEFHTKIKMKSSTYLTQCERDTLHTIISLVGIIRNLVCGVISQLRGGRIWFVFLLVPCNF